MTDCNTPSLNQTPTKGNVTRIVRWHQQGVSPETRTAYDPYGNPTCSRDANGNMTTLSYDGSATFPKIATNPLGHQTTTQYYGVDGVLADTGLYGQAKSVTDPNGAVATTSYDALGRKINVTTSDGATTLSYNNFGTVNSQHVQTTAGGLSSWSYFDGLGRTILEKKTGPDAKVIVTQTIYNNTGTVKQSSLPYFEGLETPKWRAFLYDPLGRATQITDTDGSRALACYNDWVSVSIDPNNHRKRETRDASGRLIRVDQYSGTFTTCNTDVGTPYATTTYDYDPLGKLRFVTDAKGNQTEMRYDSLGRKTFMHDPDTGNWGYQYDHNGNLIKQIDAKGKATTFVYDALNRIRTKTFQTNESFDRLDGTDLGPEWDEYLPNLEIFSNQIRNTDTGSKAARFTRFLGPDQNVSVDCKVTAASNSCALMARWSDANHFYRVRLDVGAGNIALFKTVAGTTTQLGVATRTLAYDTYYRIRLIVKGSSISVYFASEGSAAISVTDTSLTTGDYAGIRSSASAAYTNWFDNFDATVPFGDSFDKTDRTNLGPDWNEYATDLEIFSNQIRNTDINTKAAQFTKSIGPDQNVSVDCKVTASGNMCAVMARWSNADNFYYARLDVGQGNIVLNKKVAGTTTQIGAAATRTLSYNTYYKIRLVVKGTSLNVYFGNETTPAISVTDTSLSIGSYAGIRSYASAAYTNWFDNFDVTVP